ncbi:hypothetical protein Q8G50_30990, partial [Klebsiella pneumoniae]
GQARLQGCNPGADGAGCDRPELGCLRTDITSDEGVCVTMQPCSKDEHCRDPVRSTCAATFLRELYSQADDLRLDDLYCLQTGCEATNTACSP